MQEFIEELNRRLRIIYSEPAGKTRENMIELFLIGTDRYLEIEKEQIKNTYKDANTAFILPADLEENAEDYYNASFPS